MTTEEVQNPAHQQLKDLQIRKCCFQTDLRAWHRFNFLKHLSSYNLIICLVAGHKCCFLILQGCVWIDSLTSLPYSFGNEFLTVGHLNTLEVERCESKRWCKPPTSAG